MENSTKTISMAINEYETELKKAQTQGYLKGLAIGQSNVRGLILSYFEGKEIGLPSGLPKPFRDELVEFAKQIEEYVEPAEGFVVKDLTEETEKVEE